MKSRGIFGRVVVGLMVSAMCVLAVLGQDVAGKDIKKIEPMIPESDFEIRASTDAIFTSVTLDSGASMTSADAEITVAPENSVHPKIVHPFEVEPHVVGNGSLTIIGRDLQYTTSLSSTTRTTTIIDVCTQWITTTSTRGQPAPSAGQEHHALPTPDKYNTSDEVIVPHTKSTSVRFNWVANATAAFATGGSAGTGHETAALATGVSGGGAHSTAGGPYHRPTQTPYTSAARAVRPEFVYMAAMVSFVAIVAHVGTHVVVWTLRNCYGYLL
ncbi:hypothetical protein PFICI_05220 [Pestalotiopsis fici W106-1]|uniref:Uncharacterized protein n=1 Tax=Pestalotiopsis fici (strain W106-1 / CGMCC3.15140) TaxID=1229662 RepID=W3XBE3_PESFW|nr:uncharacterized protein PFICI_05220 [Pestalotiopsis fici W106-1]ETS83344.1 hypothetical protein PFICI_05220 [Pestalotiopsis fici W106-1]